MDNHKDKTITISQYDFASVGAVVIDEFSETDISVGLRLSKFAGDFMKTLFDDKKREEAITKMKEAEKYDRNS